VVLVSGQLLIILAIVIMLFGTKRLRTLGSDLGTAVKGFRKSIKDDDSTTDSAEKEAEDATRTSGDSNGKP